MTADRRPRPRHGYRFGPLDILFGVVVLGVLLFRFGPELRVRAGLPMAAPELELVSLSGDTIRTTDLRGSVVLVNFWATWCGPCLTEMPMLQEVWEDHQDAGLLVVGLSVDEGPIGDFVARLQRAGVEFPLAMATPRATRGLAFGGTLPTTVVIDREGRVVERVVGVLDEAELRRMLGELLASPEPPAPGPENVDPQ